jgi:hypothetical protein
MAWVVASAMAEAVGTAKAVLAQDFLLKLKGSGFPGPSLSGPAQLKPGGGITFDLLPDQVLTFCRGEEYFAPSQAGPGNDINAGSPGSQKAPA